ncbi:MAG: hypothetical protein ABTR07_05835 [Candidatus Competibacter denitrificans]
MNFFIDRLKFLTGGVRPHPWGTRLGWDRGLISRAFSGKQLPGPEALTQLAMIERVNLTWLLTGEGTPYLVIPPPNPTDLPINNENRYFMFSRGNDLCPPLVRVDTAHKPVHISVYSGIASDLTPSVRRLLWKGQDIRLAPDGPQVESLRLGQAGNRDLFDEGLGLLERDVRILNSETLQDLQVAEQCRSYLHKPDTTEIELEWVLTLRELDERRRSAILGIARDLESAQRIDKQ